MSVLGFNDAVQNAAITTLFQVDGGNGMHNKQEVLGRTNRLLSFRRHGLHRNKTRPAILLLLHIFVAAGTCLPSRCLATIGGIHRLIGDMIQYTVEIGF
jgi:hypothetical protein